MAHAGYVNDCDPTIEAGMLLELILKRISEQNMDLLLVVLTGQEHEGSNASVEVLASKMIRNSPVPVLTVHFCQRKKSNMFLPVWTFPKRVKRQKSKLFRLQNLKIVTFLLFRSTVHLGTGFDTWHQPQARMSPYKRDLKRP